MSEALMAPARFPVARAADNAADNAVDDADDMVQAALRGAREFLRMDVAFISEFTEQTRVFRYVDTSLTTCPVTAGGSDPLESTYCQRVVDGRLPELITDAAAVPEAAALPVTRDLPVGAHLSVPITLRGGHVYGTLCAFSASADPTLDERHLGTLRLLASMLANALGQEAEARAQREQAAADVLSVIAAEDFQTVFQPVVELATGRPVGFEALTRFREGRPDEWFARAAAAGLGVHLELATLDAAVSRIADVPDDAYLAVNLSPEAICSDAFAERTATLPLTRLVIELTEQTEILRDDDLAGRLASLRAAGARVAVDDAGSGYAGLQRVLALAPDVLKLDLDLIRGIDVDAARQALAWAMTWFARQTGTVLVAEGVETAAELEMLVALGVPYGQGFHLGRPGPLPPLRAEARGALTSTA